MVLRFACRACGCRTPRAGCPRCEARQLSLFDPPAPPVPDDAETVTLEELAAERCRAEAQREARTERLARLARSIRIGLVGCAKTKREEPSPCRELYRSPLFVACLAHAERTCDETFVISAAHGLIPLDRVVPPYDRTLRELPKKERLAWGSRVADSVRARFPRLPLHVLVLSGLEYAAPILSGARRYGWTVETPLARLSIGQRLAWFKAQAVPAQPARGRRRGAA